MKNKKLLKPILFVSVLIMAAILVTLGVVKLTIGKKTSSRDNSLKLASNTLSTKSKAIVDQNDNVYNLTIEIKKAVVSSSSTSYYDYYGDIYIEGNLLNYTWNLGRYTSEITSSSATTLNYFVNDISIYTIKGSSKETYYLLQVRKYSSTSSYKTRYTYAIFNANYKFIYQVPFPQWQTLSYNGTNYTADDGVTIGSNYIYYYALPTNSTYAGQVEKHKVTFNNSAVSDTVIERKAGKVIVG